MSRWVHGSALVAERLLRWLVIPGLRAAVLRRLGARVGRNVRVLECRFINLEQGFRNLSIGDDVHVGSDCLIDLKGPVEIGLGSTLSPRVMLLSHCDPGSAHDAPLARVFPPEARGVRIGEGAWIGAGAIVLSGASIGDRCAVGAGALVRGDLPPDSLCVGQPARPVRSLA